MNYSLTTFSDKHWWFYFSLENTTGKTIEIELQNLAYQDFILGRWQSVEPVYSYDNVNWERVPLDDVVSGDSDTRNFSITIAPSQDTVWLAPIPPYSVSMRDDLFASFAASPFLNVSSLGVTSLGQNLTVATITDPMYSDENKTRIYVIAQQHAGETVASFVAEGMIRYLLNETDPIANATRLNCIFRIVPIVNVEGVYYGVSRYTPFRSGIQYDLNRQWNLAVESMQPEVRWLFEDIEAWEPDCFFDLHTDSTTKNCFVYHDGLYDETMVSFLDTIAEYWPETGARGSTGYSAGQMRTRLGVHPSILMEHPHDNRTSTQSHPADHNPQTIDDWLNWGKGIAEGLHDYYVGRHVILLNASDSGMTSPTGDYRWLDVADQAYGSEYQSNFNYSQASVEVTYYDLGDSFRGALVASNLKPNFAYQLKLVGTPWTEDNERIGLVGRWWQEEWNGSAWDNGWNLNDKGDGSSPNPNDVVYFSRKDVLNETSPTGYHYMYTGYLLFDYFITNSTGDASFDFETGSCYHVLWKTSQSWPYTEDDGPIISVTFDPETSEIAYDYDYPENSVSIFGEWERLPMGMTPLLLGEYNCQIVLTEESFHDSGGELSGNWAGAMDGAVSFNIIS